MSSGVVVVAMLSGGRSRTSAVAMLSGVRLRSRLMRSQNNIVILLGKMGTGGEKQHTVGVCRDCTLVQPPPNICGVGDLLFVHFDVLFAQRKHTINILFKCQRWQHDRMCHVEKIAFLERCSPYSIGVTVSKSICVAVTSASWRASRALAARCTGSARPHPPAVKRMLSNKVAFNSTCTTSLAMLHANLGAYRCRRITNYFTNY
jgi:hypothetical protein